MKINKKKILIVFLVALFICSVIISCGDKSTGGNHSGNPTELQENADDGENESDHRRFGRI